MAALGSWRSPNAPCDERDRTFDFLAGRCTDTPAEIEHIYCLYRRRGCLVLSLRAASIGGADVNGVVVDAWEQAWLLLNVWR